MLRTLTLLNIAAFRTTLAGAFALAIAATFAGIATPAAAGLFHGGGGFHGGGFGGGGFGGGSFHPQVGFGGFHPQMGFGFHRPFNQRFVFVRPFHRPFNQRFVFVRPFHHPFNRRFVGFGFAGYDYSGYDAYYGCWQRVWGPFGWRVVYVCD
jgi:hypothetical protein